MVILPKLWSLHIYFLIQNLGILISWIWLLKFTRKKKQFKYDICLESFLKKVTSKPMLNQFMRKKNYSYVTFVITAAPKRLIWSKILKWFMKRRDHSIVKFLTTAVPKRKTFWSFHEKKKSFTCKGQIKPKAA